jgi:hypothetical protein
MPPIEVKIDLKDGRELSVKSDGTIAISQDVSAILRKTAARFIQLKLIGSYNMRKNVWGVAAEASVTTESLLKALVKKNAQAETIAPYAGAWEKSVLGTGVKAYIAYDSTNTTTLGAAYMLPLVL